MPPKIGVITTILIALSTGLLLMTAAFRFPGLTLDETVSLWIASPAGPETLLTRSLGYAATPPLSSVVQSWSIQALGSSSAALRLPSVVGYFVAAFATYQAAILLLPTFGARIAVMWLMLHPDVVDRCRLARPYGLMVALSAMVLWFSVAWIRTERVGWLVAVVVASLLLAWTHYLTIPWLLLLGLGLAAVCIGRHSSRLGWHVALASMALGIGLWPLTPAIERLWEMREVLSFRTGTLPLLETVSPIWSIAGNSLLVLWLFHMLILQPISMATAMGPGQPSADGKTETALRNLVYVLAIVPAGLAIFANQAGWPTLAEPRYRLASAPAESIAMAAGVVLVTGRILGLWRTVAANALSLVLVLACWIPSGCWPTTSRELDNSTVTRWKSLTETVGSEIESGDQLYVYSGLIEQQFLPVVFEDPLWHSYLACRGLSLSHRARGQWFALPRFWSGTGGLPAAYTQLIERTSRSQRVWVLVANDTDLGRGVRDGLHELLIERGWQIQKANADEVATLNTYVRRR